MDAACRITKKNHEKFRSSVLIQPVDLLPPIELFGLIAESYGRGVNFAREHLLPYGLLAADVPALEDDLTQLCQAAAGSLAAEKILEFAYYQGGSKTALAETKDSSFPAVRAGMEWGSLAQASLAQAFLLLPQPVGTELYTAHAVLPVPGREWIGWLTGAEAVAAVARAIFDLNGRSYFPHLSDDLERKIDLVVFLKLRWFCVQVKASMGLDQVLDRPVSGRIENTHQAFTSGVHYFNRQHECRARPLFLTIGTSGLPFGSYQNSRIPGQIKKILLKQT